MGTCITVIKLIGAGSLGIATGTLAFSSYKMLPGLIQDHSSSISKFQQMVSYTVNFTRLSFITLGSLASSAFFMLFKYSALRGKHPYLIYAAIAFPLSLIPAAYQAYTTNTSFLGLPQLPKLPAPSKSFTSNLDNSMYLDLGRTSSLDDEEDEQDPENAIIKKQIEINLKSLQSTYKIAASITGAAFAIATIGIAGDKY